MEEKKGRRAVSCSFRLAVTIYELMDSQLQLSSSGQVVDQDRPCARTQRRRAAQAQPAGAGGQRNAWRVALMGR